MVVISHIVKVAEGGGETLCVGANVINHAVLLEKRLDPGDDERVPELGHAGEEVMLDLEVEVAHPPVAPPRGRDVGGVVGGVEDPVDVLVSIQGGLVGVAHREVDKDVHGTHPHIE